MLGIAWWLLPAFSGEVMLFFRQFMDVSYCMLKPPAWAVFYAGKVATTVGTIIVSICMIKWMKRRWTRNGFSVPVGLGAQTAFYKVIVVNAVIY